MIDTAITLFAAFVAIASAADPVQYVRKLDDGRVHPADLWCRCGDASGAAAQGYEVIDGIIILPRDNPLCVKEGET